MQDSVPGVGRRLPYARRQPAPLEPVDQNEKMCAWLHFAIRGVYVFKGIQFRTVAELTWLNTSPAST